VVALHRRASAQSAWPSIAVDRRDLDTLSRVLRSIDPEVLVDLIGYTAEDAAILPKLPATLSRLVLLSSGDVYQSYGAFLGLESLPSSLGPSTEESPLRTIRYPYRDQAASQTDFRFGYDKIVVEEHYRAASPVSVTVLRLPMVYGPGDPRGRVANELQRLNAHPIEIRLNPREAAWRCTRGAVQDVAAAIVLAATHPAAEGRTYNLGEPEALTQTQWLEAIAEEAGLNRTIVLDPATPAAADARWEISLEATSDRIREELGFREVVGRQRALVLAVRALARREEPDR
jgi:nucleoside-diphosphate-sugar epimerase